MVGKAHVVLVADRAADRGVAQHADAERHGVVLRKHHGRARRVPALLSIFGGHEALARGFENVSAGRQRIEFEYAGIGARHPRPARRICDGFQAEVRAGQRLTALILHHRAANDGRVRRRGQNKASRYPRIAFLAPVTHHAWKLCRELFRVRGNLWTQERLCLLRFLRVLRLWLFRGPGGRIGAGVPRCSPPLLRVSAPPRQVFPKPARREAGSARESLVVLRPYSASPRLRASASGFPEAGPPGSRIGAGVPRCSPPLLRVSAPPRQVSPKPARREAGSARESLVVLRPYSAPPRLRVEFPGFLLPTPPRRSVPNFLRD